MNDNPQDAWFYSMEGERLGPVSFSELRVKALEGKLNPRLDMAWTKGMPDWKVAGEIDGLFDRRSPADVTDFAPAADPYRSPDLDLMDETDAQAVVWPGARRRSYLFMTLLFPALWIGLVSVAAPLVTGQLGEQTGTFAVLGLACVPALTAIYFGIRRYVNLGMSGWWIFGNLVPFLNIWLGYRSFACPAGYAFHKKLDGIGIFLAIVYWLMILLAVVSVALMVAVLLGAIGSPEMQKQLHDFLEAAQTAPAPTP